MNPIERGLRRLDRAQQRHRVPAFVVGVVKKYGDDNGGILASSLAHSAFVSVFPLLLILVTILGIVASGNAVVYEHVRQAKYCQAQILQRARKPREQFVVGNVVDRIRKSPSVTWPPETRGRRTGPRFASRLRQRAAASQACRTPARSEEKAASGDSL